MALQNKSLIVYGLQITALNSSIDFQSASMGPVLQASITQGFYSVTSLAQEVATELNSTDPANIYTVSVDRTAAGGTQNRMTISSNAGFFSILFASGPRNSSSAGPLLGFTSDQTGSTSYTGTASIGTTLIPDFVGYNFLSPDFYQNVQGTVNISASGIKEAIVFQVQQFLTVQFKYEPQAKVISQWKPFFIWAIQQRPYDFTPDYVLSPSTFYQVTMEKTAASSQGIGYQMKEMLPQFPFLYDTGAMDMRVVL